MPMNPVTADIIKTLLMVFGGGIVGGLFMSYAAHRSANAQITAAKLKTDSDEKIKAGDGDVILRAKLVDGQGMFEQRVLDQLARQDTKMQALESQLDEERRQRRALENACHESEMKIKGLDGQLVRMGDENRQRKAECEEHIRMLTDELIETRRERDAYKLKLESYNIGASEHTPITRKRD